MDFDLQYIFLKEYIFPWVVQGLMHKGTCYILFAAKLLLLLSLRTDSLLDQQQGIKFKRLNLKGI